jgi:hypothetical protein
MTKYLNVAQRGITMADTPKMNAAFSAKASHLEVSARLHSNRSVAQQNWLANTVRLTWTYNALTGEVKSVAKAVRAEVRQSGNQDE